MAEMEEFTTVDIPSKDQQTDERHWNEGPPPPEVKQFLQGPQRRKFEFARAVRIFNELIHGFRILHFVGPCVTVFGSARFTEDHRYYKLGRELGAALARAGFTVMTGGGPGIMEAANRGAREVGGRSLGCNITLQHEQEPNPYLDKWITFEHFPVRKLMLIKYSYAFIAMPGGFGTLDELYEVATLIQTQKLKDFPIVLMGTDYWQPLVEFMRTNMLAEGTIDSDDVERMLLTDSVEEAVTFVRDTAMSRFGLSYGPNVQRRWYLFE